MQIKASTVLIDKLHRCGSIILPPMLKTDSEGTVEVGTTSTSFARRDDIGYFPIIYYVKIFVSLHKLVGQIP